MGNIPPASSVHGAEPREGLLRFILCYKSSFLFSQLAQKHDSFIDASFERVYIARLKGCHTHGRE